MRRLENATDAKFWEAWIKDDVIFCYRFGKMGASGHTKLKRFGSRAEAEAELAEKLAEKLTEGFVESGEATAPATPAASVSANDEQPRKGSVKLPASPSPAQPAVPLPALVMRAVRRGCAIELEGVRRALAGVAAHAKGRSWKRARSVKYARRALERWPEKDTAQQPELDAALAEILGSAALSREQALSLLWELDVTVFSRALARWKDGGNAGRFEAWQRLAERLDDAELALRLARAASMRPRQPETVWQRHFAELLPHAQRALERAGSNAETLANELAALGESSLAEALRREHQP